jgi:hypothetical protein
VGSVVATVVGRADLSLAASEAADAAASGCAVFVQPVSSKTVVAQMATTPRVFTGAL